MGILYNLFGALMRWVYDSLHALGSDPAGVSFFAITFMVMALISKLITFPLTLKQGRTSQRMAEMGPKLEQIKKKYGYDERILQQKTMEFYKENNLSQVGCSSCLPLIIQLVILLALFGVLRQPGVYLFDNPSQINQISKNFLWISDLTKPDPFWFALPLFNTLSQLLLQKMNPQTQQAVSSGGSAASSMTMMMYILPIIFFFTFINFAACLLLYWGTSNVLEIIFRFIIRLFEKRKKNGNEVIS